MLYNGFKLCYLELEESVKQWGNTKLLMKTSLREKEPGRLAEEEKDSQVSASKEKKKPSVKRIFSYVYGSNTFLDKAVYHLQVKRNNAMLCRTDK